MGITKVLKGYNSETTGPLWSGPLVGEVGEHDAFIWVQSRDTSPLVLSVFPPVGAVITLSATPVFTEGYCVLFHPVGLQPDTNYQYEVASQHGQTARYRFKTAPSPQARHCRVAFGSCFRFYQNHDALDDPFETERITVAEPSSRHIFDSIRSYQPDLFVMAGDNCYYGVHLGNDDFLNEDNKMLAQLAHRNNQSLRSLVNCTPTLGIWDNHDFGEGQATATNTPPNQINDSLNVFKRMWAQRSFGLPAGTLFPQEVKGIFSSVRYGPVELFLLDDRFYRKPSQPILDPNQVASLKDVSRAALTVHPAQILGSKQMAWLKSCLSASTAPVKLIISGSVVLPKFVFINDPQGPWEGWQRNAQSELSELLKHIETNDIRGVIFLSGDIHLGFIVHQPARRLAAGKRGPEFYEIVSSPLRNNIWSPKVYHNDTPFYDRGLVAEVIQDNFGLIDVDLDRPGHEVTLRLKDALGNDLASKSVALDELRVRPRVDKLIALLWPPNDKAYFFKGDRYVRYERNPELEGVDPGYPRPINGSWPGHSVELMDVLPNGFDTVVVWPNGRAYFFSGNGYVAYLVNPEGVLEGYPKYTDLNWANWPAHWFEGIDAGLVWDANRAYFFKGAEYIRYNIPEDRVEPGYPKPIKGNWPGLAEVFPEGVDSAIDWGNGIVYFFRGNYYVRYNKSQANEGVESGYPRAITENWPGLNRLT